MKDYRQMLGRVVYVMGPEWTSKALRVGVDYIKHYLRTDVPKYQRPLVNKAWDYVVNKRPWRLIERARRTGEALDVEDLVAGRLYAADFQRAIESGEAPALTAAVKEYKLRIKGRVVGYKRRFANE